MVKQYQAELEVRLRELEVELRGLRKRATELITEAEENDEARKALEKEEQAITEILRRG